MALTIGQMRAGPPIAASTDEPSRRLLFIPSPEIQLSDIARGIGGFSIDGSCAYEFFGRSVSGIGDVNGDGLSDLMVGAYGNDAGGTDAGRAYVIFGETDGNFTPTHAALMGDGSSNVLNDLGAPRTIVGGEGNDTITVSAAGSIAYGGAGNDTIDISAAIIAALIAPMSGLAAKTGLTRIDGGTGLDTIALSGAGVVLDLSLIARQSAMMPSVGSRLASIERVDLTGSGDNSLRLKARDVTDLATPGAYLLNGRAVLMVDGNPGDTVQLVDAQWMQSITSYGFGGTSYEIYVNVQGNATVLVERGVAVSRVSPIDLSLDSIVLGNGGFAINSIGTAAKLGYSVSSAGDVNGDGLDDVIVGAPGTSTGKAYVVFGKTGSTGVELSSVMMGVGGYAITPESSGDLLGTSVAAAGDVNGDGLADILINANGFSNNQGRTYIVFGRTTSTAVELTSVKAGWGGYAVDGPAPTSSFSAVVSGCGDVNGDGVSDLLIGSGKGARLYVVFGSMANKDINLANVASGVGGYAIDLLETGLSTRQTISYAGDVNGDGKADLIVGFPDSGVAGTAGQSFVVFGKASTSRTDLTSVRNGHGGFVINGDAAGDASGSSVSYAGDINGDGLADVLVGAPQGAGTKPGKSYIVFGKADGKAVELSSVASGYGGILIAGGTSDGTSGHSVSYAGDVNGDGIPDVVIGSPGFGFATSGSNDGRAYITMGGVSGVFAKTSIDYMGSAASDIITDGGDLRTIVTSQGSDVVTLFRGGSIAYTGAGDDVIGIGADSITALASPLGVGGNDGQLARIDGGSGIDTIRLMGRDLKLNLTQIANQGGNGLDGGSRIQSIERFDLTGTGKNTLVLHVNDVLDMAGINNFLTEVNRHDVRIDGDSDDSVRLSGGWTKSTFAHSFEGTPYIAWNSNASLATVLVEKGVQVLTI